MLCIISAMLKAEIKGIGIPEKGVPQGGITVCPGDYVTKDSNGNYNAVNADVFERTFDLI